MRLKFIEYPESNEFKPQVVMYEALEGNEVVLAEQRSVNWRNDRRRTLERLKEDVESLETFATDLRRQLEEMIAKLPE